MEFPPVFPGMLKCVACSNRRVGFTMRKTTTGREAVQMLSENIRTIRKSKGLSQQELAVRLNVVRQTVSKWEQGVSLR